MFNLRYNAKYVTANISRLQRLFSGIHKRPMQISLPPDKLLEIKSNYFERRSTLSDEEWLNIRRLVINNYKHITEHNVDTVILGVCSRPEQLSLAKNYVQYLRSQGATPNTATLGRLLRVYNAAYGARSLNETEQREILEICHTLQSAHEILDATTCEHVIHGLVCINTEEWLQAIPLLEMMKLTSSPSVNAYSVLVVKAFNCGRPELAWRLLEEMLQFHKLPKCDVYLTYLQQISKEPLIFADALERLLQFIGQHAIVISDKVSDQLMALAQQLPKYVQVSTAQTNRLGKCTTCQQHLQLVDISDTQFEELRDSFLNKVLIRNDVFQKSTPAEIEKFKAFIEKTGPYDCVIDGLNVAYSMGVKKSPEQLAKLLAAVVRYFKDHQKHVLVLGRKHMRSWSKSAMNFVHSNASVFLTNNLTQDDPFLLYATLKSGQCTDFFSRDLMRSHSYLLGPNLKMIFRRWQQQHQYSLVTQTQTGQIIIKEPLRYCVNAHKNADSTWHVPCCDVYTSNPSENFEAPKKWLCLKINKD